MMKDEKENIFELECQDYFWQYYVKMEMQYVDANTFDFENL